jgi:hypothetical protein
MGFLDLTHSRQVTRARAAIAPLEVGSRVEVRMRDGEVRCGQFDGLRRREVLINEQCVPLSEVTAVFHVTSQAHE